MKPVLTLLLLLLVATKTYTQPLPDSLQKKIDHIFENWNHTNSPGCTVGIVKDDSLIFSKGYGMANLEYDIPNAPATIYHMASVSKQFTAFSIVLLARQGRLKLDDDIRLYLPWFPDLKEKITILQLLNHTSGIRDQWQLLAISGTQLNDVITQEHIIKILSKQQALNSKPGQRFNYCNSGFTLLAEIVHSITKQTLREFTDSAIFKPLGMSNTHFHDDATEIVKHRSYSYYKDDDGKFVNSILSYSTAGATSLFTNINDLSKWAINFYRHKVGDQQDIDLLTTKGRLNDGKESPYAMGIGIIDYKGYKGFAHSGSDAGYRTILIVFPELRLSFLVFSNVGNFNTGEKALAMADLFIKDTTHKATPPIDSSQSVLKNSAAYTKYQGDYITDEGALLHLRLTNNKLYADGGRAILLVQQYGVFSRAEDPSVQYILDIPRPGDTLVTVASAGDKQVFTKFSATSATNPALIPYTGVYYCPELDCKYGIELKDHLLVLTNAKYNDIPLGPAGPDHFFNGFWAMHHLKMLRDVKGRITGFEVNTDRVLHLKFIKL